MSRRNRQDRPEDPGSRFTGPEVVALFAGGLIVFFLGAGTVASTLNSVAWRLKIERNYRAGVGRVVKAEVLHDREGGGYRIDVTHRVEADGRQYGPTSWTEEETPTASTRAEAGRFLERYRVGELYPCRFNPANPDHDSVLLRDGLRTWEPLRHLWKSAVLSAPGFLLIGVPLWRARRRERARR